MIGSSRIVTCEDASRRRRKSESQSCFITPSEQAFYAAHVPPTRQRKRVESEEGRDHRDPSSTFGIVIGHGAFPPRVYT